MRVLEVILLFWLPSIIIFLGLFEAIIVPMMDENHRTARRVSVLVFIVISTLLIGITFPRVLVEPIEYHFGSVFGMGIFFKIDLLNYILMVFAGIIFAVAALYSMEYIKKVEHERSFYFFFMISYVSTIGSLMAGDLLSFFLFFEVMTFSTYGMIVHYRTDESLEAGNVYVYMGVIGGLAILSGILLLAAYTESYQWVNLADKFSQLGTVKYLIAGLFIFGFGVKAGLVPFHFWLPKAYKEAPISMNVISSGILTKIGAYGLLRVATIIFSVCACEAPIADPVLWSTSRIIGVILIWLGILSMVVGVFLALVEENIKKMLAYHSVSQMGYIVMGIGVAAYLGYKGAMGFTGSLFHMMNHGLFKALLFMVVGIIYLETKELNMYRLGGLWKKMPMLFIIALIAALGITGMPLFNGFASKSILHHAIVEAYEYGHPSFRYAEWLFTIVSAGTVCSFMKFIGYIFLGKGNPSHFQVKPKYPRMMIAMSIFAVMIVFVGLFPSLIMDKLLIPAVSSFSYDPAFISKYLTGMQFFNSKDLGTMVMIYALGTAIFIIGVKFHLFHQHLPSWVNAEKWIYRPVDNFCEKFPELCVIRYEKPMVLGDVFIYMVLLTFILGALIISRLF